ncbi:MAG: SIR2 family NAD-dependent protein deacylase [Micromonosporaceae bacterium]
MSFSADPEPQPHNRDSGDGGDSRDTDLTRAAEHLAAAQAITVLTGAGISTDSGIPDFRGPSGVWTRDPEAAKLVTLDAYVSDPEVRRRAWLSRRDHPAWKAIPNAGHHALVELEQAGRLRAIVTQNIDGLHQRAGSDPDKVIEIHGSLYGVRCLSCDDTGTMQAALDRVAAGEPDPACRSCGGILKSATISFGQQLDPDVLERAVDAALGCDMLITVGTSLTVQPAAGLVEVAIRAGARVVIVNAQPTPYDPLADARVTSPIGAALPALVAATTR